MKVWSCPFATWELCPLVLHIAHGIINVILLAVQYSRISKGFHLLLLQVSVFCHLSPSCVMVLFPSHGISNIFAFSSLLYFLMLRLIFFVAPVVTQRNTLTPTPSVHNMNRLYERDFFVNAWEKLAP